MIWSVLTATARRTAKSAQPFPSPKISWSSVRVEIYALLAIAVEKRRLEILAFCVMKFCEYPKVVDKSWELEIYPAVPKPITVLVRFALLMRPARLAVDTKLARFAVLTCPAKFAVDTIDPKTIVDR